jgi:TonB-dependent SusC/RagA subfamily outer membrane receptor
LKNISVLKDASSAAIYGMRAANGVVLKPQKEEDQ